MKAILTWHSIDGSGSPISVTPAGFRRQLAWLAAGGVRVVPLEELAALPADARAVALTFDDGFANFATEAVPVLAEQGLPVTLFVVSGHVGGDNRWAGRTSTVVPRLPLMGWDDLARLPSGLVTIAAHTRTHPHLDALAEASRLEDELAGCAADLESRLGLRPRGLAYPYGGVTPAVARAAARHYAWACTTDLRPLSAAEDPHLLPRLDAWYLRRPERLGRWGTARLRGWLRLRRGGRRLRAWLEGSAAA